jgi:DNA-directed RNA polymerase subunit RPC12/RpoP
MVIIVVECESCGQTFGIRPQDVRDRRIVHCIHCGKLVVMPEEESRPEYPRCPLTPSGHCIGSKCPEYAHG